MSTFSLKSRNPKIAFNELAMYFGRPYVIDLESAIGTVTVYAPKMRLIVETDQKKFNETLNIFTTNTTAYKLLLWENGVDWNILKDFELFCMLYKNINFEVSSLLFGDLDFSKFQIQNKKLDDDTEVVTLWNEEQGVEINEAVYQHFHQYICLGLNIQPEERITDDDILKDWYIQDERAKINNAKALNKESESFSMQPLISTCVNHPGFKYKLSEVEDMTVFEFYDSVRRLQVYENTTALLKGIYSGFVDSSHISSEDYNFMKEIK